MFTFFIVIMQVGVSVAVMQVVFSTVHYVYDSFYCNFASDCVCYSYVGDSLNNNFIFISLTEPTFYKIDRKTFKGII